MVRPGKVGTIVACFEGLRGSSCPASTVRANSPPSHLCAQHPLAGIFSKWWRTCQRAASSSQANKVSKRLVVLPPGALDGAMHACDQRAQRCEVGRRAPILLPTDALDGAIQSCMPPQHDGRPATGFRGGGSRGRPPKCRILWCGHCHHPVVCDHRFFAGARKREI